MAPRRRREARAWVSTHPAVRVRHIRRSKAPNRGRTRTWAGSRPCCTLVATRKPGRRPSGRPRLGKTSSSPLPERQTRERRTRSAAFSFFPREPSRIPRVFARVLHTRASLRTPRPTRAMRLLHTSDYAHAHFGLVSLTGRVTGNAEGGRGRFAQGLVTRFSRKITVRASWVRGN